MKRRNDLTYIKAPLVAESLADYHNYCSITNKDPNKEYVKKFFIRGILEKKISRCADCGYHFPNSFLSRSKYSLDNFICPDCKEREKKELERL